MNFYYKKYKSRNKKKKNVLVEGGGWWMDEQAKTNLPLQLLRSLGHKNALMYK